VAKQTGLHLKSKNMLKGFGGSQFAKYNPKAARPVVKNTPIHVVMRSSYATGSRSMLHHSKKIQNVVFHRAKKIGIKIYQYANVGNHLHFICSLPQTSLWGAFIKSISGLIARIVMQAERGQAKNIKFWDARPWTRITLWGSAYTKLRKYLRINQLQAIGFARNTAEIMVRHGLEAVRVC